VHYSQGNGTGGDHSMRCEYCLVEWKQKKMRFNESK